jgi:M6 family metalloprotease-like protein
MKKLVSLLSALLLSANLLPVTSFAETKQMTLPGDVNTDGTVSVSDAVLLQKWLLAVPDTALSDGNAADVYADGVIDIFDLAMLKQKLIALPNTSAPPITALHPTLPSIGNVRLLTFAVDFSDYPFEQEHIAEQLQQTCFGQENQSDSRYPKESISAYYERASYGKLHLDGDVFRYTAQHPIEYYYAHNSRPLVEELMDAFDEQIDFHDYDANGDAILDAMMIVLPETVLEIDNDVDHVPDWWYFSSRYVSDHANDGIRAGSYCVGVYPADDPAGFNQKLAHELAHAMELPDYYRYTQEDSGESDGLTGSAGYELMDEGNGDLSAFSKLLLGWIPDDAVQVYTGGTQSFSLTSMQQTPTCILIPRHAEEGYFSEYFLIEYVTGEGNNAACFISGNRSQLFPLGGGIRILHCQAELSEAPYGTEFKYNINSTHYDKSDTKQRVLRLVNDYGMFYPGKRGVHFNDQIDGNTEGFHWYDADGGLTVDTGLTIHIGNVQPGPDYEPDWASAGSSSDGSNDPSFVHGSTYHITISQSE